MPVRYPRDARTSPYPIVLLIALLLLTALACNMGESESLWTPENPKQYSAETAPVEVYVLLDEAGNVVPFGGPYAFGTNARLRYVLRFWDVGDRGAPGYEVATIYKAYTPFQVTGINQDLEGKMTEEQRAEVFARTSFPTTEIKWADLTFTGGPDGYFSGTNPDTGEEIIGHMEFSDRERDMGDLHAIFTRDIQQDYIVQGEEVFFNWP